MGQSSKFLEGTKSNTYSINESNTNADTCCLGTDLITVAFSNMAYDVYPYETYYATIDNVLIVSCATAYEKDYGNNYKYIFQESLYYGTKLTYSLINTNQLRHFGVEFLDNSYEKHHDLSIKSNDTTNITINY